MKIGAEMLETDGTWIETGNIYITIKDISDLSNITDYVARTTEGIVYVGSGAWVYNSDIPEDLDKDFFVKFDRDNEELTSVTGMFNPYHGPSEWLIKMATGITIGYATADGENLDILMRGGNQYRIEGQ